MNQKKQISVGYVDGYKKASSELAKRLAESSKRNKGDAEKMIEDVTALAFQQAVNVLELLVDLEGLKKSEPIMDDMETEDEEFIKIKKDGLIIATVVYEEGALIIERESEEE